MLNTERAKQLMKVIGERHQRELQGLAVALDVDPTTAATLALVDVFTIGRIFGMMQTIDVLNQVEG